MIYHGEQDVFRLDVPMDDVVMMDEPHSLAHLPHYLRHLLDRALFLASFRLFDQLVKIVICGIFAYQINMVLIVETSV